MLLVLLDIVMILVLFWYEKLLIFIFKDYKEIDDVKKKINFWKVYSKKKKKLVEIWV